MEKWREQILSGGRLTVKKVQFFDSLDGGGLNCDLYIDGKLALHVHDSGMGGCFNFTGSPKITTDWRESIKKMDAIVKSLPRTDPCELFPDGMDVNADMAVDFIAQFTKELASIKRTFNRKIFFKDGEDVRTLSWKGVKELQAQHFNYFHEKYPNHDRFHSAEEVVRAYF